MLRAVRVMLIVSGLIMISAAAVHAQADLTPKAANVSYASDPSDVLDLYVPDGGSAPYPVVVMFTTSSGSKDDLSGYGIPQFVVGQGYAAVTVGYRAALPATYNDAFCALAWVYANAQQYSLDTSRIALYGVSWGGLTSVFIAETADPTPYLSGCPNQIPADHALRGVITDSGSFLTIPDEISAFAAQGLLPDVAALSPDDLNNALASMRKTPPDQWCCLFFPLKAHDALYELPIFHVTKGEPPFLMVQGLADTTVPYQDAFNFAQAMLEQGDSVQLMFDPPSGHVVDLSIYQDAMAAFLKRIFA